eukprot:TRINITY_DN7249_c0_g1_i1.p1 TRINITY_DN7249_c0_g1~~TRINITY_DN7249_c0_g1_i1.p1  ORF type:complete len:452 (-),score=90.60 TRINITY_DN7249_c0_g1_i1:690-2045(-)
MADMKEKEKEKNEAGAALLNVEETKPDPYAAPDGGWGWVVMIASFMCCLVLDGIAYVFGVFLLPLMEKYEVDNATMSGVGSVLSGTIQLVAPFVALLVNIFGTRIVCIAGAVVSAVGFFLSTFSPNVFVLMLLFSILAGTGLGLMYVPAVVAVGHYFDKRRALATGIAVCGSGAGTFVLAPLASFLLIHLGINGAIRVFAGLCFACILCGLTMKPLPKKPEPKEIDLDTEGNEEKEANTNCLKTVLVTACSPKLMTNVPFLLLTFSNLFATQGLYIPYMFIPALAESKGISKVDASFLISIVGICNTLGRIVSGFVTDLPCVNALVVTTIALGVGGIAPLALPFCDAYWTFVIVCMMFGTFLSAWCAVTSPAIVDVAGIDLLTSGFGTLTFVRGFAALIGPPIAGYLVDQTGNMDNAFYLSAALLFTSGVICGFSWIAQKVIANKRSKAST